MADNTWLSAEVATELAKAPLQPLRLPIEAVALLAAIVEARSFRSLYGDSSASPRLWDGSLDAFPPRDQIGMTGPDGRPTHAFGAWQWEPETAADIAAGIDSASVTPDNQIKGSWWLAQRDYRIHVGTDLLADLRAAGHDTNALDAIGTYLRSTWPGGARAGFSARYLHALPSAPLPSPVPQITLHYGEGRRVALDGWDASGAAEPLPATGAAISVDDTAVCTASIDQGGQSVTVTMAGPGKTTVHYTLAALRADLEVNVAALARVAFDPDRTVDPQPPATQG